MATQNCRVDGWPFHEVKWHRWRLVPVTALLDFVDDRQTLYLVAAVGWRMTSPSSPDPGMQGKVFLVG